MTVNRIISFQTICLFLVCSLFIPWCGVFAKDPPEKKKKIGGNQPIQIISDRLDAYNEKKMVIFSGNAVATQSDRTIKSDQLLLYYRKESVKSEKTTSVRNDDMGELEKIEAKGHVTVNQGERTVTGDYAVFLQDSQKIIVTGNAVMHEGRNIVRGDRITVFLDEDRGIVESNENKRVKAIIYPDKDKDK